jgi:hypothetical protein
MNPRKFCCFSLLSGALLASGTALADEHLLGYTAGAETLPKGASDAYLWVTHHGDKRQGNYAAQYIRAEYEYGISDRLSASVYLNGYRHAYSGDPVPGEIEGSFSKTQFSGVSFEMKKMLVSPYEADLGVAIYGEVTYDTVDSLTGAKVEAYEAEAKLILQKPYLDGQLQWLTNLELEVETSRDDATGAKESAIAPRLRTGVAYRFAPKWFIGAEGWADAELLKPESAAWEFDHWDFFAGPSIHYGAKSWWATLTYAKQISGSDERDGSTDLHLADHEKYETRLKIGYNF